LVLILAKFEPHPACVSYSLGPHDVRVSKMQNDEEIKHFHVYVKENYI
jgi:hypothetical protein